MHRVERNIDGEFVGWVGGRANGCPSQVHLSCLDHDVQVFAVRHRPDVLHAGFTLFSGFHLRVSTVSKDNQCHVNLEDKVYNLKPLVRRDTDLIKIDNRGRDYITGWVKHAEGLRSLSFFSTSGLVRAEVHKRSDVNDHLGTPAGRLHGFRVESTDIAGIYALNVNNELIHWLSSNWFE